MSELNFATYELNTKPDDSAHRIEKKRNRFVEMLTVQKERITNVDATMTRGDKKVPVKKLWDETKEGVFFCPMIGRRPVLLDGKHNSIRIDTPRQLSKTLDALITQTRAGAFDSALEAALARVEKAPSAAPKTTPKSAAKSDKK